MSFVVTDLPQGIFADVFHNNTVHLFLAGLDISPPAGFSSLALRAQATLLFSRASIIASQYKNGQLILYQRKRSQHIPLSADSPTFQRECVALNDFVSNFINTLPRNPQSREDLVTAALAHVSLIQLHAELSHTERKFRDACVAAARATFATLQTLRSSQVEFIDPIVAVSFTAARSVK